jgi:hypothetical protein
MVNDKQSNLKETQPFGLRRSLLRVAVPPTAKPGHFVPDGGSPGIGHTVWLPPAGGPFAAAVHESELPAWALFRIAAQFLPQGGRLGVCHGPGPGREGLDVTASPLAPGWMTTGEHHHGGQPLPGLDAALVIADPLAHEPPPAATAAVRFWRALRQAVHPGGVVLAHTHHDTGGRGDAAGLIVKQAAHAGLGYLQHHVIVHTRLLTDPLSAADSAQRRPPRSANAQPRHRRVHSDLLVLGAHPHHR